MSTATAAMTLTPVRVELLYRLGVTGKNHLNDIQCRGALWSHGLLAQEEKAFPADFPAPAMQLGLAGRDGGVHEKTGSSPWIDGPHCGDVWLIRDVEAYIKPRYAVVLAERAAAKAGKKKGA